MAINPHIRIEDLDLKWQKGRCSLCGEPCDSEGYLHFACAEARHNYIEAERKEFWRKWKEEQEAKKI